MEISIFGSTAELIESTSAMVGKRAAAVIDHNKKVWGDLFLWDPMNGMVQFDHNALYPLLLPAKAKDEAVAGRNALAHRWGDRPGQGDQAHDGRLVRRHVRLRGLWQHHGHGFGGRLRHVRDCRGHRAGPADDPGLVFEAVDQSRTRVGVAASGRSGGGVLCAKAIEPGLRFCEVGAMRVEREVPPGMVISDPSAALLPRPMAT